MADKPLGRVYFAILRKTAADSGRTKDDPFGTFSCRANVARFLNIEANAISILGIKRKAHDRSLTLADGTNLKRSAKNTDSKVAESLITLPLSSKGSRTVILKTGKKTKADGLIYHTLSFRFPAWATIWCISDALGTVIPTSAIKREPTQSDVFPFFTIKGGRTYPIMEQAEAKGNTDAQVATNPQESANLAQQSDKKSKKAAG